MPDLSTLFQPVLEHTSVRAALERALGRPPDGRSAVLSGLTPPAKALLIAGLAHSAACPLIVLTTDTEAADRLREAASTFLAWLEPKSKPGASLATLAAHDCTPYENRSPHAEIAESRAVTLWRLAQGRTRVLFVPLEAALGRFRERSYYRSWALEVAVGNELPLDDVIEHLAAIGYEANEPVAEIGQFSLRGGILDVFPPEAASPVRIEFFGDQIDSMRAFDPATQRSQKAVESALVLPLTESSGTCAFFDKLVRTLDRRERRRVVAKDAGEPLDADAEPQWAPLFSNRFPGWEFYAPLAEPHPGTLFSLVGEPAKSQGAAPLIVWDEPLERKLQLKDVVDKLAAAYDAVRDVRPGPPRPEELFLTEAEFWKAVENLPQLGLKELSVVSNPSSVADGQLSVEDASPGAPAAAEETREAEEFALATRPAPKFQGDVKAFSADLKTRLGNGEHVVLVMPSAGKLERLREILTEYEVPFTSADDSPVAEAAPAAALVVRGELEEGVFIPELGLMFFSDRDLFGSFEWRATGRRERSVASTFISDLSDLKVGDYVVHVDHGIGLYRGLRQLAVDGNRRDFMLLTYQDDARLYVPLERLDLVEKYRSGGDGAKPALDKLGGTTWARTKTRVKRALRDMAEELLKIYAERKMRGGTAYTADTPWQREFENAFEFEETPDQLTALGDIKRDLESPQPMDRLLCGDVGYGKTELAMRAAFKVVQDGRQVAVLCPTTVLASQHYNTFRQRLAAFPVRIEMLSRFRSAAEQKKVVADVASGSVDVLIGTHRLLSKDVAFHDLGLLVVDEEQRFGVAAKEKLKRFKANVDVLTMSATPIPRTLNMSLGGLRDLSVIETPPRGRLAIQTVVTPFGPGIVQSAILEEMRRQGQVYFVHNRVESIYTVADLVQKLVPTARLGVAHGQMGERELEKVMLHFIQGKYDVLVSTVLIENGLDISRANTLIVNHAERFGLADLYQLRGRVGRSDRRAYAFFLIPAEETLTGIAKRRLAALKEFSDLGAGFRLAALDLELRGAGNLLGAEQSGHLTAVGIDLYMKMLEETVEELKGQAPKAEVRTTLNLGLDIKIPERYISDERQRLRMYKRISSLASAAEQQDLEAELTDRYGPPPEPVKNLFRYALLKSLAEQMLVHSVERQGDEVWLRFHSEAPVSADKLTRFMRGHRDAALRPDGVLRFRLAPAKSNGRRTTSPPATPDALDLPSAIRTVLQELHA